MRSGDWEIKKTGKDICCVQRYLGSDADVVIPDRIDGFVPVEIGPLFLKKNSKVRSVTLPGSIDFIDPEGFPSWRCVEHVEGGGRKLKASGGVLYDGAMKTLVFYPPKRDCEHYEAPDTLRRVADGAFAATVPFRTFAFPPCFEEMDADPADCRNLESFIAAGEGRLRVKDGVLFKGDTLLFYPWGRKASEYMIPEGTAKIARTGRPVFPPSVASLHVPFSLKAGLEDGACLVGAIEVDPGNGNYVSSSGVLFSSRDKKLLVCPAGKNCSLYMVPKGTVSIAAGSFRGSSIRTLILPSSVLHIEAEAFAASAIEELVIPMTVVDMDIRALYGMERIRKIWVERRSVAAVYLSGSFLADKAEYIEYI